MTLPAFFLPAIANNVTTPQLVGAIGAADVTVALKAGHGALLPSISRGDASSTGDSMTLNDTGALGGLAVGDPLYNLTDGSHCVVTSIASAPNSVKTTPLEGGSDNTWQSGDIWVKGAYVVTVIHYDTDGVTVLKRERMLVTNRVTDTLTVVRGYDSDSAQTFSANDYVQILVEKSMMENLQKGLRNILQKLMDIWRGTPWSATTTGSSNAYAATIPNVTAMTELLGVTLRLKLNFSNTGTATLNVNGLGAYTIRKTGGTVAAASGDLPNGMIINAAWDGTYFQMLNPVGQSTAVAPTIDFLIVGGGGGGGGVQSNSGGGGGGGGGGVIHQENVQAPAGSYTVTVGAAGSGGTSSGTQGTNGDDSYFYGFVGHGGGGGGGTAASNQARIGGCGGGEAWANGGAGAAGIDGFRGGKKHGSNQGGGGGGGAAAQGVDATTTAGANGGVGYTSSITGSSVVYGSGGGGGSWNSGGAGTAGTGGGNGGDNSAGSNATGYGCGGGGGGGTSGAAYAGGNGFAGVVIIRYLTASWGTCTGGTITTSGSYTIHTFTTSGTFGLVAA